MNQGFHQSDRTTGEAYEQGTGRWSRQIAPLFIDWLAVGQRGRWLDVGCGTGALIQTILDTASPSEVVGIDRSSSYIAYARQQIDDPRVRYEVGDARSLPVASSQYDAVVSGLLLNQLSPTDQMVVAREMVRGARAGGVVGLYVWDYAEGLEPRSIFWEAAIDVEPRALEADERARYPICRESALERLLSRSGLAAVETTLLESTTSYDNFEAFWKPYVAGYGAGFEFLQSLRPSQQEDIRDRVRDRLATDGPYEMSFRAIAAKGVK